MNCEKCNEELLLIQIAAFYTEYECPACGHRQIVGALGVDDSESVALRAAFNDALDELREMSGDFTEGSQQRWMLQMRKANELRDELWRLDQANASKLTE